MRKPHVARFETQFMLTSAMNPLIIGSNLDVRVEMLDRMNSAFRFGRAEVLGSK